MPRKIVVVGAGSTGFQLARQLIADNQDVTLIERNADTAKYALNHLDCMVITGAGNDLRLLRRAGIQDAEFFIALTDSDEFNMVACGLASREFSVPFKIARVRNQQYHARSHLFDGSMLDIDYIVNPEIEAGRAIVQTVEHGATSEVVTLGDTDIEMRVLPIMGDSAFCDRTIAQARAELPLEFLVCGLLRGERFYLPRGDTRVREGDELYLSAPEEVLDQLFDRAGRPKLRMRQVILVGGGRVGSFVAESLVDSRERSRRLRLLRAFARRRRLKIIESDTARSKALADRFPGAIVINSDISDEGFFEEESLQEPRPDHHHHRQPGAQHPGGHLRQDLRHQALDRAGQQVQLPDAGQPPGRGRDHQPQEQRGQRRAQDRPPGEGAQRRQPVRRPGRGDREHRRGCVPHGRPADPGAEACRKSR